MDTRIPDTTEVQTVVIGGGQAGLAVGYHLAQQRQRFVILEANDRVGTSWRDRWDSLRLFTPARYDGLPGMRFPARGSTFPRKDEMADYLEAYARRFDLPVLTGVRVDELSRHDGRFVISAAERRFECDNVVVAMANFQRPRIPAYAQELSGHIRQLHSTEYRNPAQLREGVVLIVGAGNSGSELALEVSRQYSTLMAGVEPGHVPFRIERLVARFVLLRLVRFAGHHVLTAGTPLGRKLRPRMLHQADPLIRVKPKDLVAAGVERVAKVVGARGGLPLLEDGRVPDVANVIWCTGFHPGFSWIDLPVFGDDGEPAHERGIVAIEPGLYFVGLHFLYAMTSSIITGVGRDAKRVAKAIAAQSGASAPQHVAADATARRLDVSA